MDAFFASLEEREKPHLRGQPIVVGADPAEGHGRGVVSTANYKAREYGIHSALPISRAWQASEKAKRDGKPEVVFITPNFHIYEKSSHNIITIIKKYSDLVEQGSIDEFYLDLSKAESFKKAELICQKIKNEIKEQEKVTCSIGLGPNKLIAKIAAAEKKPDGFFAVSQKESENFLAKKTIDIIPGIGPKTKAMLNEKKIFLVDDIKKLPKEQLIELMGKWGEAIYDKARGIDDSALEEDRQAKSIGEQHTFQEDTLDALIIGEYFLKTAKSIFSQFQQSGFLKFKTITVTIRFSNFKTITSSKSFTELLGPKDFKKFYIESLKLLLPFLDKRKNPQTKKIRHLGITIKNFTE